MNLSQDHRLERGRRTQPLFFRICVLPKDGKTFSDLLNALKKQLDQTRFGWRVLLVYGLCECLNCNSVGIVKARVARELNA